MAANLTASVLLKFTARQTGVQDFGGPDFNPTLTKQHDFTLGTGANQADLLWSDQRTIAASGTDDIDLAGVLTDAYGTVIASAELVALLIVAATGNTNNLIIGLGTNPFLGFLQGTTPAVKGIGPGGSFFICSPNAAGLGATAAGASDILRVANSAGGTTVTYDIALLARTVA